MKIEIRVPTSDPYAFIDLELGPGEELTDDMIERASSDYIRAKSAILGNSGLPEKEFNSFIDRQLLGEANHMDEYQKMTLSQQGICQAIKKALKRIEAKQTKE